MFDIALKFLNDNLGFVTLITAASAFVVYWKQKSDKKSQIARLILLEIRTAEEKITQVKNQIEGIPMNDFPSVLPINSWNKYAYLFVKNFDSDELKLINSFYNCCERIEEFAKRDNNFFWVTTEERARVMQSILGNIINEAYDDITDSDQRDIFISNKKNYISGAFDKHGLVYSPQKSLNEIKNHLNKVQTITTSTCGVKLKRIAKLK